MHKKIIKCGLLAMVIIAGILWYLLSADADVVNGNIYYADTEEASRGISQGEADSITEKQTDDVTERLITVHICGEVQKPGVYSLPEGTRLVDALKAAGGVTLQAEENFLNLARLLADGERIEIPSTDAVREGTACRDTDSSGADTRININSASKEELMRLPGIGEGKADNILLYRSEHGAFRSAEDIMQVNGIKEALYERLKDYIKVR